VIAIPGRPGRLPGWIAGSAVVLTVLTAVAMMAWASTARAHERRAPYGQRQSKRPGRVCDDGRRAAAVFTELRDMIGPCVRGTTRPVPSTRCPSSYQGRAPAASK
jgi:hypothetical protein